MLRSLQQNGRFRILALILVVLVLLPALFFSLYELGSLSQTEELMAQMYRQQLDAALFSANQFSWDIAESWAREINRIFLNARQAGKSKSSELFESFLTSNQGVTAFFVADTVAARTSVRLIMYRDSSSHAPSSGDVVSLLHTRHQEIARLSRMESAGYRKIEGITIRDQAGSESVGLLFVIRNAEGVPFIAGVFVDAESFVLDMLRGKLDEIASGDFLLSVIRKGDGSQVYATGPMVAGDERQSKDLWLFPDYQLGIRMRGQTIEEIVRERFTRNLILLVLLDLSIFIAVWFVYRTVRREMELARQQSDFISNVSHELRTPLSLIRMFAETLEMGRVVGEKKKKEYYLTILRETERLTGLVNHILNFSRMESGKRTYQMQVTDLTSVIEHLLTTYSAHMKQAGFTVHKDLAHNLPSVLADEQAVSEALLNLIDNALKYGKAGQWIGVKTKATEESVIIEVTDRGIGISGQEQQKIFEKFYRASDPNVRETKGSGLGLALVRHIMNAHKGSVTVSSRPGSGSTFRLSFPRTTRH